MIRTYSQIHRTGKYSQDSLNHLASLAKWLSVRLRTKWLWVRIPLQSQSIIFLTLVNQFNGFDMIGTLIVNGLKNLIFVCFTGIFLLFAQHWPEFPQILIKYFYYKRAGPQNILQSFGNWREELEPTFLLLRITEAHLKSNIYDRAFCENS